ncbi:MAG: glutaminase [Lentisphaerae bacterium RIFOXYA12_FULL_48_11]|nr:MAG: glutaminase [Lentisphaerae bacterium RIFOXYA12_FULL_48_11]
MKKIALFFFSAVLFTLNISLAQQAGKQLRPPSAPLVACDPYFSIWSPGNNLNDVDTTHWTGKPHRLSSSAIIDGKPYRIMGGNRSLGPAFSQKSLSVLPTRTIYTFEDAGVALTLTFLTPALPDDIEILSRPVTYLTYEFRSADGKAHEVQFTFEASAELTVNTPKELVTWSKETFENLTALKIGSKEQNILGKKGDDIRIDWGYLYVAAQSAELASAKFTETSSPAPADTVTAALNFDLGKVSGAPASRRLILAYDDIYSIQYMKQNLRPYWRRNGWEAVDLLKASTKEYETLAKRCVAFDDELMADLTKAGGRKFAEICALSYRQCFAAGKFVADAKGRPISFCKENHSNGCIATSDVFYPMAPQFLFFGPTLAKSFIVPFMNYAASDRWKFPFAPHDLGQYPKANGQVYGGGERTEDNQMPVEESGNLLILFAAVAQMEGNADFAGLYWPQLERWADYLKAKGFDPENQLCTDDFAGHLAHNVNLSAKAICGLGSFAKLCEMRGDKEKAKEYSKLAKECAAKWIKESDDGDHSRLAYDRPNTWSQKYNLVWDKILDLSLFPSEVLRKEMAYYRKIQNIYGLPLDNRKEYTKLDWTLWTATLTQNQDDFEALVTPVYLFINETPDRSPLTDWYQTKTAKKVGFTARPVIGGVFMQMLYEKELWKKYACRDTSKTEGWAPMPVPPVTKTIVTTAKENENISWRYTTEKPADSWFKPDFDASAWKEGKAGFGTSGTPGSAVRTEWKSDNIWLRREVELPVEAIKDIHLIIHHDEDAEIFINGIPAASASGYTSDYEIVSVSNEAKKALKPSKNIIAVHCTQTKGGQYIDLGLADIVPAK